MENFEGGYCMAQLFLFLFRRWGCLYNKVSNMVAQPFLFSKMHSPSLRSACPWWFRFGD
jgi:hypothetical protein